MANNNTSANVGFEDKLWQADDKLRYHMDPLVCKHVVLGLVFLKCISDSFEQRREELKAELADSEKFIYTQGPLKQQSYLEDRGEYIAENVFWVVPEARWSHLHANARNPKLAS